MIYVSKKQIAQVEYLIEQSTQGNHVLFDSETLRRVFRKHSGLAASGGQQPFSEDEAYSVEPHIERLIALPSLEEKRAYLERLDRETFERVVRTYFNIVENNIYESQEVRH